MNNSPIRKEPKTPDATLRSLKSQQTFLANTNSINLAIARKATLPSLSTTHNRTKSGGDHYSVFPKTERREAVTPLRGQETTPRKYTKSLAKGISELNLKSVRGQGPSESIIGTTFRAHLDSAPRSIYCESDLQYYESPAMSALHSGQNSPLAKEKADIIYTKQEENIKKNPHFQKFHNSLHIIDKAETIKFSFPREFFWSSEQVEYNNEIMRRTAIKSADGQQQQLKILKEGKKETINLYPGRSCYFRIRAENRVFPMYINITSRTGTFEGIVGKTDSILKQKDYDYIFSTDDLKVSYDNPDSIKYIYIAITAIEKLRMDLAVKFSPNEEFKKKDVLSSTQGSFKDKLKPQSKRNIYEYFKEGMKGEDLEELRELVNKIRKEKRIKSLNLANNRDLVKDNIESAREFKTIKIAQLEQNGAKREFMLQKNRENKVFAKVDKEKQLVLSTYKHKIKRIEQEWKEKEAKDRQERLKCQRQWLVSLTINNLLKSIQIKKRARIAIRIFERARETKIIKIQRLVRKFLQRPLALKTGQNKHLLNNLSARIAIKMFELLNTAALVCHKSKIKKAATLVALLCEQAAIPVGATKAVDLYYNTIVKIQRRWKSQMEMFNAKIEVFLVYWHQFCLSLITGEFKKKKKKYSETIPLIKEVRVAVMARQYIQEKMTAFLREVREFESRQLAEDASEDPTPKTAEHDRSFSRGNSVSRNNKSGDQEGTKRESNNTPLKSPGKIKNTGKAPQLKLFKQIMMSSASARPKFKIKPTNEELKELLDKLIAEMKVGQQI